MRIKPQINIDLCNKSKVKGDRVHHKKEWEEAYQLAFKLPLYHLPLE
ncbi:MAG: hypothetical protein KME40_33745 [Komarekiella atlantica HA4396-MV6]|nr:hypothetical protein [Komarekiella atlantica HA4396-MV6]